MEKSLLGFPCGSLMGLGISLLDICALLRSVSVGLYSNIPGGMGRVLSVHTAKESSYTECLVDLFIIMIRENDL